MKKLAVMLLLVAVMAGMASAAGFQKGKTIIGPLLGLNYYSFAIGAQGEYGVTDKVSAGGLASYSSKSYDWGWGDSYKVTYIAFGGQANYHFKPGEKFDPFAGAVFGYEVASVTWPSTWDTYGWAKPTYGGPFFGGNLGFNYDLSPTMLGRAQIGYPYYIAVGVSFKI
jgi:hypothetical protein